MTSTPPTRVALIGAGLAASPWLAALDDLGVEVVTVATRDEERFAGVRALFPRAVRQWPPEAALEVDALDACLNLSPPHAHLEGVRLAAEHGLPVLVEKPLATTLARARQAVDVAREAGVGLGVCLQYRYREGARALAALLSDGALGRLRAVTVEVPWYRTEEYYRAPGRGTYARDGGGVLMTQAIHAIDLALWLCGPPEWVWADLRRASFHQLEAEDLACAALGLRDGVLCTVLATTGGHLPDRTTLRLFGTSATAVLEDNVVTLYRDGRVVHVAGATQATVTAPMDFPHHWHRELIRETLTAFRNGLEPPVSGRDALTVQAVIAAMEESSHGRTQVPFRDPAGPA